MVIRSLFSFVPQELKRRGFVEPEYYVLRAVRSESRGDAKVSFSAGQAFKYKQASSLRPQIRAEGHQRSRYLAQNSFGNVVQCKLNFLPLCISCNTEATSLCSVLPFVAYARVT
mmetsp:Transcript_13431/g.20420  ORF Transcript_13431/g.20420 Transcript_13431/m.20420 type:complete len:114 (-) Transcript_13431:410-751(-)